MHKSENWFLIRLSTLHIFHVNMTIYKWGGVCISVIGTGPLHFQRHWPKYICNFILSMRILPMYNVDEYHKKFHAIKGYIHFYPLNWKELFLVNGMQTPSSPPPSKRAVFYLFLGENDTQCSETNGKLIFRLLFFELWSILFIIFKCFYLNKSFKNKILSQKMRNILKRILAFS